MSESTTQRLQKCLDRLHAGDASARGEMIAVSCERFHLLARKMFRDYPRLRRWEGSGDVAQMAVMRLLNALQKITPDSLRHFFLLAAVQIRRVLIDLARHYFGPEGLGARHETPHGGAASTAGGPMDQAVDIQETPEQLEAWTKFHETIGKLPEEEREVFDLLWYQGLTTAEAAELLGGSIRTVQRHWQAARLHLYEALDGQVPGL
jgi:RNA polymerase sigma-70 factor (ECF subfamily)